MSAAFHPFEIPKRLAILLLEKTNESKILQDFETIFSKQKSISFFRSSVLLSFDTVLKKYKKKSLKEVFFKALKNILLKKLKM